MLDEQTLKKFKVVAQRERERSFLSFLSFGFGFLFAFPTTSCCLIKGIDSELSDQFGLEAARSRLFNGHGQVDRMKKTTQKTTQGNLESWGPDL
jgi:hypothetical protein